MKHTGSRRSSTSRRILGITAALASLWFASGAPLYQMF